MMDIEALSPFLDLIVEEAVVDGLPNYYRGKVRDNYSLPDGTRLIITTDRLSAFDKILTTIPLKGQVLTQLARFWFDATVDLVPNHVISYPDPNVVLAKELKILPIEIVVRDYLTGSTGTSIWPMYRSGKRELYGWTLPDGMRENQKLPQTIITPTTKAFDGGHDEPISVHDVVSRGILSAAQWEQVQKYALTLFERGRAVARDHGLILVDTKYEFGLDPEDNIILADEIHTPDSSRYWFLSSYPARYEAGLKPESFDKDFVRTWVTARCDPYREDVPPIPHDIRLKAASIYIQVFEQITGRPFSLPDVGIPPAGRIKAVLEGFSNRL